MKKKEKISQIKRLSLVIFFLGIVIVSFLSLWRALGFDFWRDDWGNIWDLTFHPETSIYFDNSATLHRYPGLAVEKVVFTHFFGPNVFDWQLMGIIFRVVISLSVALMLYGMTRSKTVGILVGLFSASLVGGLESVTWISANSRAIFIIFLTVGIYFWVKSLDSGIIKEYVLSLIFLCVAVIAAPAEGLLVFPVAVLWDFLTWIRVRNKVIFQKIAVRVFVLGVLLVFTINRLNFWLRLFTSGGIVNSVGSVFTNPDLIKNYVSSLGNLLTSWIYQTDEPISLGNRTIFNQSVGVFFVFVTLLIVIFFLKKRSRNLQVATLFLAWMFLFYLPNWLYEKTLVVGSSHRYVAVSSVAFASLITLLIYKFRSKYLILFSSLFIILNIIASNKLLEKISTYRSSKIIEPIWSQINSQVTPGQKGMIFMYQGTDLVWGTSMNWSGSVPFGIKRGISNADDLPIITGDKQLIVKLLCEKNVYRPTLGGWIYQKDRIPTSHLYAWSWNGKVLTDISQTERELFTKEAPCKVLP